MSGADDALRRISGRAVYVAAALRYLGTDREQDAEQLGELMLAATDALAASATVVIQPDGEDFPGRREVLQQLANQTRDHTEQIAHKACRTMIEIYMATLRAAARARGATPIDD